MDTPTNTPPPNFETQLGWVAGQSPLSEWNYHYGLRQWVWFPEPTAPRLLVSGAGTKEVNGVYTLEEDGTWSMLGTDFYLFLEQKKFGNFWIIGEKPTARMYYVSRAEAALNSKPYDMNYWMHERGLGARPVVSAL